MHAHFEWRSGIIRLYGPGDSFATKSRYRAVISVSAIDNGEVYLFGMHGSMDRESRLAVLHCLAKEGVTHYIAERAGRRIRVDVQVEIERHQQSSS